jgi:hypothetical protein
VRSAGGTRPVPTVVPCLGTLVPGVDLMAGSMTGNQARRLLVCVGSSATTGVRAHFRRAARQPITLLARPPCSGKQTAQSRATESGRQSSGSAPDAPRDRRTLRSVWFELVGKTHRGGSRFSSRPACSNGPTPRQAGRLAEQLLAMYPENVLRWPDGNASLPSSIGCSYHNRSGERHRKRRRHVRGRSELFRAGCLGAV